MLPKKYKVVGVVATAGLIALAVSAIWGENGWLTWERMQADLAQLNETNFRLHRDNQALRNRIERLQHDDKFLERYAREHLGLVRPGEILYRLATPTPVLRTPR